MSNYHIWHICQKTHILIIALKQVEANMANIKNWDTYCTNAGKQAQEIPGIIRIQNGQIVC